MSPCWGSAGPGCGRRGRRYWGRVRARVRRRGRVGDDETALLVPLHVPHTPQRLDLGVGSFPVVPVLEVPLLEDELAPPVARVQVSDPSGGWEHTQEDRTQLLSSGPQSCFTSRRIQNHFCLTAGRLGQKAQLSEGSCPVSIQIKVNTLWEHVHSTCTLVSVTENLF